MLLTDRTGIEGKMRDNWKEGMGVGVKKEARDGAREGRGCCWLLVA